jgi:hypothetical protein
MLVGDVAGSRRDLLIAFIVALCAVGLPQGYVVGLGVGTLLYYLPAALRDAGA